MPEDQPIDRSEILTLTTDIVSAHVSNNSIELASVPDLIQAVFEKLSALSVEESAPTELTPAVPVRRSVTDEYIICLEDGKRLRMLKRYLMTTYGMTPEQYRAKWGLKADYPMVAPAYARKRQELAKVFGLGKKKPVAPAPKSKRVRAKGAA